MSTYIRCVSGRCTARQHIAGSGAAIKCVQQSATRTSTSFLPAITSAASTSPVRARRIPAPVMESLWADDDAARDEHAEQVILRHQQEAEVWRASLSPAESKAVSEYSRLSYTQINGHLREGKAPDARIRHLDAALAKTALSEPAVRYRGVSFFDQIAEEYIGDHLQIGALVSYPSYLSTSDDPTAAASFALGGQDGFVLEILTDKGAPVFSTMHEDEFERLLPRGMKFEVTGIRSGVEFRIPQVGGSDFLTVVQMREVDDESD